MKAKSDSKDMNSFSFGRICRQKINGTYYYTIIVCVWRSVI